MPAVTVVVPVYALTPFKVSVLPPLLVSLPAVAPNPITPENAVLLVELTVRVFVPIVALPPPARFFTVWFAVMSSVVPAPTVTPLLVATESATDSLKVPAFTLVAPVYELATVSRVSVLPAPVLVSPPDPLIKPEKVVSFTD